MNLDEILEVYLDHLRHEKNMSFNTILAYRHDLKSFFNYIKERRIAFNKVTHQDIRGFLKALYENGNQKSTVSRKVTSLREFFKFCMKQGFVEDNPAKLIPLPKYQRKIPTFLTESEAERFLELPLKPLRDPLYALKHPDLIPNQESSL
jgi:integrase/recombinase XerC